MSITQNPQRPENLRRMCAAAFPGREVKSIAELTEGMCNVAYRVDFADGASVLKIAAADPSGLLSNEINLMHAEVAAMRIVQEHGVPLVPKVQFADFTRTICSGNYFFMECLPGRSLSSCSKELTEDVINHVHFQSGQFQQQLSRIHGVDFGPLGLEPRFPTLHDLVRFLIANVLRDAENRSVDLQLSHEAVLARLEADSAIFAQVQTPSLVHWDMWEGNIFVEDGEMCGIIDWERAMWGDPLLDDRFRSHNRPAAFLEGFGHTVFTPEEQRRIAWYDLFLYLTMYTESFYREYENPEGLLRWLRPLISDAWARTQAA